VHRRGRRDPLPRHALPLPLRRRDGRLEGHGPLGRAQNGYLFWGIIKQPARESDPVAALDRAWERYEARAKGILESSLADETKATVLSTVRKHAAALEGLQGRVA